MEFIEKSENIERIYSVYYDSKKLKDLLNEIVRKASYKIDGQFAAPYDATFEGNVFTSGASLPNGDPMYENIKRIYRYTSLEYLSYPNDAIGVEGTLVTPPQLAYIIEGILHETHGIEWLLDYKNSEELISIDEKIAAANKDINEIDNFDFDKKIVALNKLKRLCSDKEEKKYFDTNLLKQYYLQVCSLFELELISEKAFKNSEKVLLKDYKSSSSNI